MANGQLLFYHCYLALINAECIDHTVLMLLSFIPLQFTARWKGNKRVISFTGSGKSLHDPVSMYEDESLASLKEKLIRAEEVGMLFLDTYRLAGKFGEFSKSQAIRQSNFTLRYNYY